jgi:hypothetical protein
MSSNVPAALNALSAALGGTSSAHNDIAGIDAITSAVAGLIPAGGVAPADAHYVVALADASLPNAILGLSGTYTPAASALTGLTSVTPAVARYMRIGSIVFVSGSTAFDPSGAGGACAFEFDLPVASQVTTDDLAGTFLMTDPTVAVSAGSISGFTLNRARFSFTALSGSAAALRYTFAYTII